MSESRAAYERLQDEVRENVLDIVNRLGSDRILTFQDISLEYHALHKDSTFASARGKVLTALNRLQASGRVTKEMVSTSSGGIAFRYKIGNVPELEPEKKDTKTEPEQPVQPVEPQTKPISEAPPIREGSELDISDITEHSHLMDLMSKGKEISLGAGENLFSIDDSTIHVYQVTEGLVLIHSLSSSGQVLGCGLAFPGDVIIGPRKNHTHSGTAIRGVTARSLDRRDLNAVLPRSALMSLELAQNLSTQLQRTREFMAIAQKNMLSARIATFLLWLKEYQSSNGNGDKSNIINFPFPQETLGVIVAGTRPKISVAMKELEKQGIIDYTPTGRSPSVVILDEKRLRQVAGEEIETDHP